MKMWRGSWRQLDLQLLWRRLGNAQERSFSSFIDKQAPLPEDLLQILEKRMSSIEGRYGQLSKALGEPEIAPDKIAKMNKELRKLEPSLDSIKTLRTKQKEFESLKTLMADSSEEEEMRRLASEELQWAAKEVTEVQHEVLLELLPKDDADSRGCIVEIRAGAGGDEASLFASDLFRMYERYALRNSWRFEVMDITCTDSRGYKEASASICGDGVYGKLKFESGVHRVQRVPVTEKAGRIHTSTASVVVLPEANEVDVQIRNEDLRIDTYRSGGAGGQHVNTTNSAVRVTHVPTGIVVAIQDERSQHKNKAKALKILCAKLFELERSRAAANRSELRQDQMGSGDRSERIRTYNFPQGRVTDHRVGVTQHSIEQIMEGDGLDTFVDALKMQQEVDALASLKAASG